MRRRSRRSCGARRSTPYLDELEARLERAVAAQPGVVAAVGE